MKRIRKPMGKMVPRYRRRWCPHLSYIPPPFMRRMDLNSTGRGFRARYGVAPWWLIMVEAHATYGP